MQELIQCIYSIDKDSQNDLDLLRLEHNDFREQLIGEAAQYINKNSIRKLSDADLQRVLSSTANVQTALDAALYYKNDEATALAKGVPISSGTHTETKLMQNNHLVPSYKIREPDSDDEDSDDEDMESGQNMSVATTRLPLTSTNIFEGDPVEDPLNGKSIHQPRGGQKSRRRCRRRSKRKQLTKKHAKTGKKGQTGRKIKMKKRRQKV